MRLTYKLPVRLVLIEAEEKAGQVVEPWSDMQLCCAIVEGSEAAKVVTSAATAAFVPRRSCFWRRAELGDRQHCPEQRG